MKKYNQVISKGDYSVIIVKHRGQILEVLIDNEDVDKVVNLGSWHGIFDKTLQTPNYYIAHRYNNKVQGKGVIKLHRLIMNCPSDKVVDHINRNTLDNRKKNLRICTRFENQQNLGSNKVGKTGVYQRKRNNVWGASISKDKVRYSKEFKTKEDAIQWRKDMEYKLYGEVMP